ncbi:PIN domain-containing protein [Candidatus Woesearchaeota archaeon]|nr:PIN domain-containing protein [Candidatus Woesearchaeota archaeon]
MVILDTTVLVDLLRGDEDASELVKVLEKKGVPLTISTVTAQELVRGAYRSRSPDKEMEKVDVVLAGVTTIPFDLECAKITGRIEAVLLSLGRMIDAEDVQIAGTALARNAQIITRNAEHFSRIKGLSIQTY